MTVAACEGDITAARAGDARAMSRLLGANRHRVVRYAERHCVVHDVEDAVQETLLIASRRLHALRVIEAFNGWLFRIVKRECDRMKRAWRTHVHDYAPGRELEEPVFTPVDDLRRDLLDALVSLPPHYREAIMLRDVEALTIEEMTEQLGTTREAVKARLHRARTLVREYLTP